MYEVPYGLLRYCTVYRSAAAHRMMRDDFVSIKTQATIRPYTQQNEKYESAKQKYAKNNKKMQKRELCLAYSTCEVRQRAREPRKYA